MAVPLTLVDAFTDQPFAGNPAAVCFLPGPADAAWMQRVAREMNQAETAFLYADAPGASGTADVQTTSTFHLRWFTPTVEVALCGHATLASAHVLWEAGLAPRGRSIAFHTQSGVLSAAEQADRIELDFPTTPPQPGEAPAGLLEALGVQPVYVGFSKFDCLVEVESPDMVRQMSPDHALLRTLPVRGVIVTSVSDDPRFDFISRFFAPGSGIDEDPVTGSAHCVLGSYWAARLGRTRFTAYQASPRGGIIGVVVNGDRVCLSGQAVTVLRGELAV